MKLLPDIRWTSGTAEGGYEGEEKDEGAEVPSSVRRRLIFTTPQEERRLAQAWRDLESLAKTILSKTVRARALALLRRLTDGGYISWRPDTLELVVDGIEHKGTNLVDLVGHVVRQRRAEPLVHGSPGRHGFAEFAATLRCANASHELMRNRCRWPQIYSDDDNDDDDGTEAEDVRAKSEPSEVEDKEEELWEEEAIESLRTDPSTMTTEESDWEEDYAMPPRSDKQDQNPFAHWESNN